MENLSVVEICEHPNEDVEAIDNELWLNHNASMRCMLMILFVLLCSERATGREKVEDWREKE